MNAATIQALSDRTTITNAATVISRPSATSPVKAKAFRTTAEEFAIASAEVADAIKARAEMEAQINAVFSNR